jgi:hypothetical protein
MLNRNIKILKIVSKQFSTKPQITFKPNEKDETILEVEIPEDLKSQFSFSNINKLPLYENFSNTKYYQMFLPLPKTNMLILTVSTIMAYSTPFFQPALLLTLYCLKKYFLTTNFKMLDVNCIDLLPDGQSIIIKNYFGGTRLDLGETEIGQGFKLGKTTYYELINKFIKTPLYINDKGKYVHKELFNEMFNGEYETVKFNKTS